MTFNEYQEVVKGFCLPQSDNIEYLTLGLVDEIGEVLEYLGETPSESLFKELGDVMWYIANLSRKLNIPLSKIAQSEIEVLDPTYLFVVSGTKIAGKVKKYIRDGNLDPDIVQEYLVECFSSINKILSDFGQLTIAEVMQMNVDKLTGRKKRGTIQGSGDNR